MNTCFRLPGRQAEAARNNHRILEAAREVFLADPAAPIAAVAERAGVGIGALYRRYRSKEALLARLLADNLVHLNAIAERALADDGDPWEIFCRYLHDALDAFAGSLSCYLSANFPLTDEIRQAIQRGEDLDDQLFVRTRASGALRPDISYADILQVLHLLHLLQYPDAARSAALRHRYLDLFLAGAHADAGSRSLSGEPLTPEEFADLLDPDGVWHCAGTREFTH